MNAHSCQDYAFAAQISIAKEALNGVADAANQLAALSNTREHTARREDIKI